MHPSVTALKTVLSKLDSMGYTIKLDAIKHSPRQKKLIAHSFEPITDPLDHSPIHLQIGLSFDALTYEWLNWLKSNNDDTSDDWHIISIDPEVSPLTEAEDWTLASSSKVKAFAWVIGMMNESNAEPVFARENDDGSIVIDGSQGAIATISPLHFSEANKSVSDRVSRIFRNITRDMPLAEIAKRVSKIQGLEGTLAHMGDESFYWKPESDEKQFHDITCSNLCRSLQAALQPYFVEPIKQSLAQELVAIYFGFDSWNVFRGLEKKKSGMSIQPYQVSLVAVESAFDETPLKQMYYRNLTDAIAGFGSECQQFQEGRPIYLSDSDGLALDNMLIKDEENSRVVAKPYKALKMNMLRKITDFEEYQAVATAMLQCDDLQQAMKDYFFTGLPAMQRELRINQRAEPKPYDYLQVGDWLFYKVKRNHHEYACIKPMDLVGRKWDRLRCAVINCFKAGIVEKDGEYWVSEELNGKPKFLLKGLKEEDIQILVGRYFDLWDWEDSH